MSDDMFYARVCAERDQLRAELAAAKNLLARIHRDGGHHTQAVGVARSIADADGKVSEWLLASDDRDALAADNARLRKAEKLAGKAIQELTAFAERWAPAIPHEGSCGPESGCDGICVEIAWLGRTMRTVANWKKLHETLAATPAQSLVAHDAALLREVMNLIRQTTPDPVYGVPESFGAHQGRMYAIEQIEAEADRIEQEAQRG